MALRHARGRKATMPQLLEGQFAVTKDTEEVFAGINQKNVRVLDEKDRTELLEAIENVEVDTSGLATKTELQEAIDNVEVDTTNLATKPELNNVTQQLASTVKEVNGVRPTDGKIILPAPVVDTSNLRHKNDKLIQTDLSEALLQQMAGNTPINAVPPNLGITEVKVAPKSITAEKTTFIRKSTNLLNHKTISATNKTVDITTGEVIDSTSATSVSDFIPIKPSTIYTAFGAQRRAFYNAEKQYLSYSAATGSWVSPDNAYYMRFVGATNRFGVDLQLNEGDTKLPFELYYEFFKDELVEDYSIKTNKIESESITPYDADFFEKANNLYFLDDSVDGYVIDATTGNMTKNTGYSVSGFIKVKNNQQYVITKINRISFYDVNKRYLSTVNGTGATTGTVMTAPAAASYARVTVALTSKSVAQFNKGSTLLSYDKGLYIKPHLIKKDSAGSELKRYSQFLTVDSADYGVPTTYTEIYAKYDQLMADYPEYITKTTLGQDAKGNNLVEYKFINPTMSSDVGIVKQKIGILTGLHGNEKNPAIGAFNFFKHLTENPYSNEILTKIKGLVDFHIIPIGNPTGWNADTRPNWNNVNLNRNFDANWDKVTETDKGASPASEPETQIIQTWLSNNMFDYYIDYHNTNQMDTQLNWMSVKQGSNGDTEMKNAYFKVMQSLSVLWSQRFPELPKNTVFGRLPISGDSSTSKDYATKIGLKNCTLETVWTVSYTNDGKYGQTANIMAIELISNIIMQLCKPHI